MEGNGKYCTAKGAVKFFESLYAKVSRLVRASHFSKRIYWSGYVSKVRQKIKVLIFDDLELTHEMLGSMLGKKYEILEAENGA